MKKALILRGLPSSGKSFLANQLKEEYGQDNCFVCCADDYFTDLQGIYTFNPDKLGAAHNQCKKNFIKALLIDTPYIIVANTNLSFGEVKEYVEYAAIAGYQIEILEPETPWRYDVNECFRLSCHTHKVPLETIQQMYGRMQISKYIAEQAKLQFNIDVKYPKEEAV